MYCELHGSSAFSFLDGASLPEDLVARAVELGLPAVALVDRNGVYGAPRFYRAAKEAGLKALVGAELSLTASSSRLTVLVESRTGYKNLCRLITSGALGKPKGEICVELEDIARSGEGLHVLTGGNEGPLARAWEEGGADSFRNELRRLAELFPGCVHVELQRHRRRDEERRNQSLVALARELGLPLLATNGVKYAKPGDKELYDVLSCIRLGKTLDSAGRLLEENRERHIKSAVEMGALFADLPEAVRESARLADRLAFTLADLGYRFPDFPLPEGETPDSHLAALTWSGAKARILPLTERHRAQLAKELALIGKLKLAGYFLIVWDIVRYCRSEKILVQGRGSAANSVVCYALGITAVDPVRMDLLFERFLSEGRGEWPDIDLDLPSGDRREKAIQHLYKTYGERGAAMTANVITYRPRSGAREVAKALGYSAEQQDRLARRLGSLGYDEFRTDPGIVEEQVAAAGLDPSDKRVRHFMRLFKRIQNLPRHLGQHSGGMVLAGGRLDEVAPLEPASMPGRVVVQWDKDDCADLGIIKVDLLGLGMLAAIEEALPMIEANEGVKVDLAQLPQDDPLVYKQLNEADTVGVFQLESRAQMASLPRHAPTRFYDIVVQVAIIRPGPIVGGMIRPFFERRRGRAPVEYPHPCLEPILKRTLGVPLFQEQVLKMAMAAAGFSGGQAEELRRAMGFKRSVERMDDIETRLRAGMAKQGIEGRAQDEIVKMITSFALYGFPESHAASFALIAYASAWLKARHPAAFYASLLNAWPMGFYHPATIVKDAQRHGTEMHPIDVAKSGWICAWEANGVRLGLRFVKGLKEAVGLRVEAERTRRPFENVPDLARRCSLSANELERLAHAGALADFGLTRREALWQAAKAARPAGPLFEGGEDADPSPLAEMSPQEETLADYRAAQLTAGPHLMAHLRERLSKQGILSAAELAAGRDGQWVRTAGSLIVRQRPDTAKGFVFLTLEDESGMSQAIVTPDLFKAERATIVGAPALIVEGVLQKQEGALSVKARKLWRLDTIEEIPAHDFR